MPSTGSINCWMKVGPRYFIRFSSHTPRVLWHLSIDRQRAYCFASVQDAQRVVDQLRKYGRRAQIVTERPKPETPPPPIEPPLPGPERHLAHWVDEILMAGFVSGKADGNPANHINAGIRALARQHHTDRGGRLVDIQDLNGAVK
jgi:hypothetical protein